jgi:signal transduction histidine kinase
MQKRVADVTWTIGVAALYVAAARLGLAFDAVSGFATLVWPASGISLAVLMLLGLRFWPGIFIGAVVANLLVHAPIAVALGIGVGNTIEAIAGTFLLRRSPRFSRTLETVNTAVALIVLAAVVSTLISATVGVASLYLGHVIPGAKVQPTWRAWWIGDMVGVLLVGPVILVWTGNRRVRFRRHWPEVVALSAALLDVSTMVFFRGSRIPTLVSPFHELYILLAIMIWAALRFGPRGAATAACGVSAIAVVGTSLGYGPFAEPLLNDRLFLVQTFMAIVAAIFLVLGAAIAERESAVSDAREAREEASRANLTKSEFLAVMSHELRTPLNAIAGYSDLLKSNVYGPLNEKQTEAIANIHRNEKQLLGIVEEVFGFIRAEKGQVSVKSEDVQVAAAFDAVEPLIEPEFRRKHFVVKRDLGRPQLAVHADPKSLEQILMSLLSNATKYTSDGGEITLGATAEGRQVRIWVRDTGVGISQAEIDRVFDPFFQADRGRTRRFAGVGLGLTIARDLARRMKGEITIASKPGSGTTASVVLPAA